MEWLNLTEIILQLAACIACYMWGKSVGIGDVIGVLLHKKIISEKDLDKLKE